MNWVDFVAILPYYLDLATRFVADGGEGSLNFGFLRILRLSRAARLIKLSKYSQGIRLVTNAMSNSVDALQLFALLLVTTHPHPPCHTVVGSPSLPPLLSSTRQHACERALAVATCGH